MADEEHDPDESDDSGEIDLSKISGTSSTGDDSDEVEDALKELGIDDDDLGTLFGIILFFAVFSLVYLFAGLGFWGWAIWSDADLAIAFRKWLGTFWPLLMIYLGPAILLKVASTVFIELQKLYDHKYPDDMDVHTGHWLEKRLEQTGLSHEIQVGGVKEPIFRVLDAYDPGRDIVFLGDITYHKKDPTFWAIAAHELGHAIVHREHKIWSKFSLFGRRFYRRLFSFLPLWAVIASLLASELAATLFFAQLGVAIFSGVLVCIDEWWASHKALIEMSADDRVQPDTVADIRRLLLAAFSTYAAPLVAMLVMAAFSMPLWELLTSGTFRVGNPLEGGSLLVAQGMGVALVLMALAAMFRHLRSKPKTWNEIVEDLDLTTVALWITYAVANSVLFAFFFALTWNAAQSTLYTLAIFVSASRLQLVFAVLEVPMNMVSALVGWAVKLTINAPQEEVEDAPKIEKNMKRFDLLTSKQDLTQQAQSIWIAATPIPLVVLWFML